MNRRLTIDGYPVNSELCSDPRCCGPQYPILTPVIAEQESPLKAIQKLMEQQACAIAEKDALLAEMAGIIHDSRCDDDCRKFAFECIAFGECKCAKGKTLAEYEAQK